MTRARILYKVNAPTYGDFYARASAKHGPVIRGAHLDVDPDNPEALRDPFRMARRFAHLLASETGQPFAWGWFEGDACGMRPGVWPAEMSPAGARMDGRTDQRLTVTLPNGKVAQSTGEY
jgi:hypothetical protein